MGRNAETEVQSEEERRGLRNAPQFYVWLKYKTRLLVLENLKVISDLILSLYCAFK